MTESTSSVLKDKKGEIIIALIGLLGVLVTAALSNWDKVFPPDNAITATYSGYMPTGNIETEVRYHLEITGTRQSFEASQTALIGLLRSQLASSGVGADKVVDTAFDALEEAVPATYDRMVRVLVPITAKHFSLKEIQELNRFYSTPTMREFVRKQAVFQEALQPVYEQEAKRLQVELMEKVNKVLRLEGRDAESLAARTFAMEGFSETQEARVAVEMFYHNNGKFPNNNEQAGLQPPAEVPTGRTVDRVTIGQNGTVEVLYADDEIPIDLQRQTLVFVPKAPASRDGGGVEWECTGGSLVDRLRPKPCQR